MNLDLEKLPSSEQIRHFLAESVNRRNMTVLLGVLGGILAIVIGSRVVTQVSAQRAGEAWNTYSEVLDTNIGSKPASEIRTYVEKLEELLTDLDGSAVTPWLLKDLGNTYFYLNEVPKAREAYDRLRSSYPNHVATIGLKTPLVPSDTVTQALEDCSRQEQFFSEHSLPPEPTEEESQDVPLPDAE